MVICILAWTKGCGYWLVPCPRQGQEVQRGSPCPVMQALSWSSGSLRAGRVSWGLETAPGLPPWVTTRGHKGLLQWIKCMTLMTMKSPIFTCPSDVFLVFCGILSSQLIGCAWVRLMESPPLRSQPSRSSEQLPLLVSGKAKGVFLRFLAPGEVGLEDGECTKFIVVSFTSSSSTKRESQLEAGLSHPREEGLEAGLGLGELGHLSR